MPQRKVFFSFHYKNDVWRAAQIRNIGVLEGNPPMKDNEWEKVKGNESSIKKWIDDNMYGKSCVVVLVGEETYDRKWVQYEIKKGWNDGKGVVGIYIHNLKDQYGNTSSKGKNPFENFDFGKSDFSKIVHCYNPTFYDTYADIKVNIADWIEEAIQIRNRYPKY